MIGLLDGILVSRDKLKNISIMTELEARRMLNMPDHEVEVHTTKE